MTAADFKSRWEDVLKAERARAAEAGVPEVANDLELVTAPQQILKSPSFPPDAARFLVEAGLPGSCAPFLSFDAVARGPLSLVHYFDVGHFLPSVQSSLDPFYVLGFDGAGNPFCLDTKHGGEVVALDHEDSFQTRTFVASNVQKLAEALLILHTSGTSSAFVDRLRVVDPRAAEESAFFPMEAASFRE
jgi:hypothetical protein